MTSTRRLPSSRAFTRFALNLALTVTAISFAQATLAVPNDARSFFSSIVGEWVGTCHQSTNGKQADDKYFHVIIKQSGPNTFSSSFDYYRLDDKTQKPLQIGTSSISTTIGANGVAENHIVGKGTMMVDLKPKEQKHDLKEVLSASSTGLVGKGSGTLSVSGMPLGLGKNGKIKAASSSYALKGDVLTIDQTITAGFKALFFTKNFAVVANYTAKRGTDIASLLTKQPQVSSAR